MTKKSSKKKLKWRLKEPPTVDNLGLLVDKGIIDKDEAREILLSHEIKESRSEKSLKQEIKFLRKLVQNIANSRSDIITTIREVEVPVKKYPWYEPYYTWIRYDSTVSDGTLTDTVYAGDITTAKNAGTFSEINTFN